MRTVDSNNDIHFQPSQWLSIGPPSHFHSMWQSSRCHQARGIISTFNSLGRKYQKIYISCNPRKLRPVPITLLTWNSNSFVGPHLTAALHCSAQWEAMTHTAFSGASPSESKQPAPPYLFLQAGERGRASIYYKHMQPSPCHALTRIVTLMQNVICHRRSLLSESKEHQWRTSLISLHRCCPDRKSSTMTLKFEPRSRFWASSVQCVIRLAASIKMEQVQVQILSGSPVVIRVARWVLQLQIVGLSLCTYAHLHFIL